MRSLFIALALLLVGFIFAPKKSRSKDGTRNKKVRCPKCGWKHDWQPHWGCELCGAFFDTFVTRANCPEPTCGNSWELTWCPKCRQPSPHEAWYVEE